MDSQGIPQTQRRLISWLTVVFHYNEGGTTFPLCCNFKENFSGSKIEMCHEMKLDYHYVCYKAKIIWLIIHYNRQFVSSDRITYQALS